MSSRSKKKLRLMIDGNPVTFTKEQWESVANELLDAGPIIQESLIRARADKKGTPEEEFFRIHPGLDPETFEADIRLACTAVAYVANFATDKCRFIVEKEDNKNVQ